VFVLLGKLERMAPVKKIIGMLLLAAFLCGTVAGCGSPTSKPAGGATGGSGTTGGSTAKP
jgi:hypothetical protein